MGVFGVVAAAVIVDKLRAFVQHVHFVLRNRHHDHFYGSSMEMIAFDESTQSSRKQTITNTNYYYVMI